MIRDEDIKNEQLRFCMNINEARITPEKEARLQRRTLKYLGSHAVISFNFFEEKCNLDFTVDLINKYSMIREIRLGLAQPIVSLNNSHLPPESYSRVMKTIVEFSDLCNASNITINFDCGFTLCRFSDEDIGRLFRNKTALRFVCDPAIDIGTDLSLWYCFPLSKTYSVPMEDFKTLQELADHLKNQYRTEEPAGIFPQCRDCVYLTRNQCRGGCIGHYYQN
jgi:hypothetical protein